MHIPLTNFLRKNKVLFSYQFGFQNNYSTNHARINLTEMIRNALKTQYTMINNERSEIQSIKYGA